MPPQEGPKVQGNSPPRVSPPSPTLGGEIRRVASVHSISPAMWEGIEARFPTEQASYK